MVRFVTMADDAHDSNDTEAATSRDETLPTDAERAYPGSSEAPTAGWREWRGFAIVCAVIVAAAIVISVRVFTSRSVPTEQPAAILTGHTDSVNALAFSPDSKTLASAGSDDIVRLWDLTSHRQITSLPTGRSSMEALAFSPDGRTLVGVDDADKDPAVHLWDVVTRKRIGVIPGAPYTARGATFSPDGTTLAVDTVADGKAAWDLATHRRLALQPEGNSRPVIYRQLKGAATKTGILQRWRLQNGKHLATVRGIAGDDFLAFDTEDRPTRDPHQPVLQLQDSATRHPVANLTSIGWSSGLLVVLNLDGSIEARLDPDDHSLQVWDFIHHRKLARLGLPERGAESIAFSPNSKIVAAANNYKIMLWPVPNP